VNNLKKYDKNRDLLETGDLIAFEGNDPIARVIQKGTRSRYSHVGLVVRIETLSIDRVFIAESTTNAGVVLVPLKRKLKNYSGKAWFLPLEMDLSHLPTYVVEDTIKKFIFQWAMDELGKKYDFKLIADIVKKIFLKHKIKKEDQQEYICSEFVATAYKEAGILPKAKSTNLTPKDICELSILGSPKVLV
jgi:hypothetical protein